MGIDSTGLKRNNALRSTGCFVVSEGFFFKIGVKNFAICTFDRVCNFGAVFLGQVEADHSRG